MSNSGHQTLVILAGGASSRMKNSQASQSLTDEEVKSANSQSKSLIGLGKSKRPLLDYLLIHAKKAGYTDIYLIVGEKNEMQFKELYGSKDRGNIYNDLTISYALQYIPEGRQKPMGTADAVTQALEQYPHLQDTTFTVCNSDNLYSVAAMNALRNTKTPNAFISYDRGGLLFSAERIARFALVLLDSDAFLVDIIEKPAPEQVAQYEDVNGILRVSMNIFKLKGSDVYPFVRDCPVHPERNEKELPHAILNMCHALPKSLIGIPFKEHVLDLTSKDDIAIANMLLTDFAP